MEEFKRRMMSEDKQRIETKLEESDKKFSATLGQRNEFLTIKVNSLRKRNQSISDKLSMFRT